MTISSIASSVYTNHLMSYQQATCAVKQSTETSNSTKNTGDSVSISEEAQQKRFSDSAFNLLITRKLSGDEIEQFGNIIQDADSAENAKDFLKNLSTEERSLVKRANSYGLNLTDSHIDTMSEEGARNMLVQPDNRSYVDFNNDGIVDHGVAKTFVFPPPNAPQSVKDAWDKTMEQLPEGERLLSSSIFLTQQLCENIKTDSSGKVTGFYQAGEKGYTNIFPQHITDWVGLLDKCDEHLDFAEKYAQSSSQLKNIEEQRTIISSFRSNLTT